MKKTTVLIGILARILVRDRLGLALYGIVPVVFLTIFGLTFGGMDGEGGSAIKIAVVDLDDSTASRALISATEKNTRLALTPLKDQSTASAKDAVARGKFPGAIVIPKGLGKALDGESALPPINFIFDSANPIAPELARGALYEAAGDALGAQLLARRLASLEKIAGPLTARQSTLREALRKATPGAPSPAGDAQSNAPLPITETPSTARREGASLVTYYTGAIGMMFLLFSASTICGTLLEERQNGLTARLSAIGVGAGHMIVARFLFTTMSGILQLAIMLAWARLFFGVQFFSLGQLAGLALLVPLAAASAAGLGLVVTAPCTTRTQQSTISVIVVLVLSAIGGSMVPSFMMPQFMQDAAAFAFNAWGIEAFQQVLWYSSPEDSPLLVITRISNALLVLAAAAAVGLIFARAVFRKST